MLLLSDRCLNDEESGGGGKCLQYPSFKINTRIHKSNHDQNLLQNGSNVAYCIPSLDFHGQRAYQLSKHVNE